MAQSGMSIQVDETLVKPVIEAQIQAAIVAALAQSNDAIVAQIVKSILTEKVDKESGRKPNYSSRDDIPFLEWLCRDAIRQAARKAVIAYMENNQEAIDKAIAKQFKESSGELARVFVEGITKSMKSEWSMKVDIGFQSARD